MTIHRFNLGSHLKVHSYNATPPQQRVAAQPPALLLVCHGIYTKQSERKIRVPSIVTVRFAVEHGEPNASIDRKYFEDLFECGLDSALEYDFKVMEDDNWVYNYHLGKGEPDKNKGRTPADWLSYRKVDRLARPQAYNWRSTGAVGVLSSAYVENLMLLAAKQKKGDEFDIASVRRHTRTLSDVFWSIVASRPKYEYLLCAFCRELAD